MTAFLVYAYLFFIGSTLGWGLEVLFRRFISRANPERKWINPGFCIGPYLPLYGSGLCILYAVAAAGKAMGGSVSVKVLTVLIMALGMTFIEFIAGMASLKFSHVRLWDYTGEWGNLNGVICPKFSAVWAFCAAGYYFFVHPYILNALAWLSDNLAFSFVIGFFFGVFTIDAVYSSHMLAKIKAFADENDVVVRYEDLKMHIRNAQEKAKEKTHFLLSFSSVHPLAEHLKAAQSAIENRMHKKRG